MRGRLLLAVVLLTGACSATPQGAGDGSTAGASAGSAAGSVSPPSPTAAPSDPMTPSTSATSAPAADGDAPATGPATDGPGARPTVRRGGFDVDRALEVMRTLAGEIGARPAGSLADVAARSVVREDLRGAGWEVATEEVALPQGGRSANLVATRPGPGRTGPHVVVGAHLDTKPDTPGANDNGTGVGVLVAVAEEIADEAGTLGVPVVLVAFGAEELQGDTGVHHIGSRAYAEQHGDEVVAMVSVDMVGHADTTCVCWLRGTTRSLADRVTAVAAATGRTGVSAEPRGDISDHGPFARRGVPAVMLWTYDDGVYHTPQDTPDRVHGAAVARTGELVLALLRDLRPADAAGLRSRTG